MTMKGNEMLNRILMGALALSLTVGCDDSGDTVDNEAGTEAAGAETAGAETAGAETAGAETAGAETAGTEAQGTSYSAFMERGIRFFAELTCQSYITCAAEGRVSSPGLEFILNRHTDVAACADDFSSFLEISTEEAAVEAGLINFDADLAAECLGEIDAVSAMTCDELLAVIEQSPESCDLAVQGTVEIDGACSSNEQCVNGAYCPISGEEMCEISSCTPEDDEEETSEEGTLMAGETCEDSQDCAGDLLCSSSEMVCAEASWSGEGEVCEFGGAKFCNPGLVCQFDFMTFTQTCITPGAMGEACFFGPQCEIGLTCEGANLEEGMPGTCGPLSEAGGACSINSDCVEGLFCANGVCGERGEPCPLPMSSME